MQLVAFNNENGGISLLSGGESIDMLLASAPPGAILVQDTDLPSSTLSDAWEIVDGAVVVNQIKAAKIGVPSFVTMRQARLVLLQIGVLNNIDEIINAMPSPKKEAARIEWQYSQEVYRNWPLVMEIGPELGLTDTQLDDLFRLALTL